MRRLAPIFLLACGPLLPARGHDIPNARVDRSIQVTLHPGRLTVDYEVSLSELTLVRDLRMLIGALPGADRRDWFAAYGRETGPLNARGLLVTVDRRPIDLRFVGFDLAVEEHPRYLFHYEAETARAGHLTIQDTNYAESEGTSRMAIRGRDGVAIIGDNLPPDVESIAIRPVWQLSDADERRTRQVGVDYTAPSLASSEPESTRSERAPPPLPSPQSRQLRETEPVPVASRLSRLLDRSATLPLLGLALIAFGLGALHALQPGHGKTLVAATVLGERGSWLRGAFLALVTTLTHTGSVLLVAIGLWWTQTDRYGEIHLGLAHAAGCLIAAIGLWRLGRHLARHGEHDDGPSADRDPTAPRRGLVGLGIAGGLVPCWDAVLLIVLAEATGRLALGIGLLVAFGLGMAVVLVAVGVLAARVRRLFVNDPIGIGDSYGPWERRLGIASGLTLAAIGVYLLGLT